MKWHKKWKDEKWFPSTIATCSAVVLYFVLSNISTIWGFLSSAFSIISPVILGIVFAYIMDPIARFVEKLFNKKKKKYMELKRSIASFIAAFLVILVLGLLVTAVIPPLFSSASGLISKIGASWSGMEEHVTKLYRNIFGKNISFDNFNDMVNSVLTKITTGESEGVNSILESSYELGSGFVSVILGFILAIYFMIDKVRLQVMVKKLLKRILNEKRYNNFASFCYKSDKILLRYLAGDLLEALIVGTSNAIFMAICRLPYIGLISVIVGITNLAPTFGPIFGALVGSILLLLINPWYALWFLIFTAIIQTIDGYILKPKFFGDTLGVSPLLILITIILGGRLYGAIGIVLSIPFAAIVQCYIKDFVIKSDDNEQAAESDGIERKDES